MVEVVIALGESPAVARAMPASIPSTREDVQKGEFIRRADRQLQFLCLEMIEPGCQIQKVESLM